MFEIVNEVQDFKNICNNILQNRVCEHTTLRIAKHHTKKMEALKVHLLFAVFMQIKYQF
jgi:hypothetical protein